MSDFQNTNQRMQQLNCCVIIPTYNNEKTLDQVIRSVQAYTNAIIVVNDGSTDNTNSILANFDQLVVSGYSENQGKGYALRYGFKKALELGFDYAITIDSDGQHFASDIPVFLDNLEAEPGSLIVGARDMNSDNVPGKSSFGHKFSNFWFRVETGIDLPDTQSGYRLYPIRRLANMRFFTKKYEFEIEVMVRAAWKDIPVTSVPIKVYYAPGKERVSHFRPFRDFSRVSVLNFVLVNIAFFYSWPVSFLRKLTKKKIKHLIKTEIVNTSDSNLKLALSVAFGIFMGIVPIWGYQLVTAIFLAYLLKLNKALVIIFANISLPPLIPLIIYFSILTGGWILNTEVHFNWDELNLLTAKENIKLYLIGSVMFAIMFAITTGLITLATLSLFRRAKQGLNN